MTNPALLSRAELLELLAQKEQQVVTLQSIQAELQAQREQLRQQDIAIQTKDKTIEQLTQERDEYKLAFDKLMQQRFRNRSERYIDNPDQLRLDFGNTAEAADAALGLAEAVEDLEQTIPEHTRRKPRKKRDEKLPDHLPRYEVTAEVSDEMKACPTHGERTLLPESMWDQTKTLEFERPKLNVRLLRRNTVRHRLSRTTNRNRRRQQVRHEHRGRDHHRQVQLSHAHLSATGLLCR